MVPFLVAGRRKPLQFITRNWTSLNCDVFAELLLLLLLLRLDELRHEQPKIDQLNRINTRRRLRLEVETTTTYIGSLAALVCTLCWQQFPQVCCEESTTELRTRATDVGGV